MPAPETLEEVARRTWIECRVEVISSNEDLERRMDEQPGGFDLVFPSDYMVERLVAHGRLREFESDATEASSSLAQWARRLEFDVSCRRSVAIAFGTTGLLFDRTRIFEPEGWDSIFRPTHSHPVGLLGEVREVVAAALLACGRAADDLGTEAMASVRRLVDDAAANVVRVSSDGFVDAVRDGAVAVHHAWSGPAAHAVRAVPESLGYVVPAEGAVLWVTTAAIPVDAPAPASAERVIAALLIPQVAQLTVMHSGFATPVPAARELLPAPIRDDSALFPDAGTLARCTILKDASASEMHRIEGIWSDLRGVVRSSRP